MGCIKNIRLHLVVMMFAFKSIEDWLFNLLALGNSVPFPGDNSVCSFDYFNRLFGFHCKKFVDGMQKVFVNVIEIEVQSIECCKYFAIQCNSNFSRDRLQIFRFIVTFVVF